MARENSDSLPQSPAPMEKEEMGLKVGPKYPAQLTLVPHGYHLSKRCVWLAGKAHDSLCTPG